PRGEGRRSVPHRAAQSSRAVRGPARQDALAGDDDRQEPARVGDGRQGTAAAGAGAGPRAAVEERAQLHDDRGAAGEGGGRVPGLHRPQRPLATYSTETQVSARRAQGMTTVYEYWQHRATGDIWAVKLR